MADNQEISITNTTSPNEVATNQAPPQQLHGYVNTLPSYTDRHFAHPPGYPHPAPFAQPPGYPPSAYYARHYAR